MASKETSREAGAGAGSTGGTPGGHGGSGSEPAGKPQGRGERADQPDWSHGLRQLYDSVVEEDLPDSFKALLDKLDETDPDEIGPEIDDAGHTSDKPPSKGGGA